ncbi:AAA family ATPase [Runella sp.]|uniref:AAA family ATPase n=1 Tax=Runella sp. TaxID=1960881 RepID=UPI003D14A398
MLQSIEIENFRCFEKTAISGFEQINLITGKNNSGKTALLEALYFSVTPDYDSIRLGSIRRINDSNRNEAELFFNQDINNELIFRGTMESYKLIKTYQFQKTVKFRGPENIHVNVHFITNSLENFPEIADSVSQFDKATIAGYEQLFIDAIQIIDSAIVEIRTFASKPKILYLRKENEKVYQPIHSYGDAIQKIINYVAVISDFFIEKRDYQALLIDEIENGIHYTAQAEVWRMLMKLCKHYNIQLFATTHSLEMIKAYQQVCSEKEFEGMGGYFELGRSPKTQQIIGVKHDLETLEYELASGDTIRGE